MPRSILLIGDDRNVETEIRAALHEYEVISVPTVSAAIEQIKKNTFNLLIIDYDLKGIDGLQIFRQVQPLLPRVKTIMLSASNNIPLAVSAAKMGAADFLRKPITGKNLLASVAANIISPEITLLPVTDAPWLQGESAKLTKMMAEIGEALSAAKNLILLGGLGLDKQGLAAYIHSNSPKKNRSFRSLDLVSFKREGEEALFWGSIQEIMAKPQPGSAQNEEERCGTLYLDNVDLVEENFRLSILKFFSEKRGNLDSNILVALGMVSPLSGEEINSNYSLIGIPALCERKEDLPWLINLSIKELSIKHNKPVKGLSAEALAFLMLYDYPGNYRELACILEQAVLRAPGELIEVKDLPLDPQMLIEISSKKILQSGNFKLKEARQSFEKDLYGALSAKTGNDWAAIARFLDLPKTVLNERAEELGVNPDI